MSEDPRRERILAELREQAARQREAGFEPVDDAEAAASMEALLRDMVKTYGHSADERRLDDIDAHFAGKRDADRDATAARTR